MRREVEELRQYNSDQALARELAQLKTQFGDSFNPEAVIDRAYQEYERSGYLPDPRSAYFQMLGEQAWASQSAKEQFAQETAAGDAAAAARAAEAGQLLGGHTTRGGMAPIEDSDLSITESIQRALAEQGLL